MKSDYDIIKDKFSEKMAKACRSFFPTLLENQGQLSRLMLEKFYPNPTIYQDLVLGKVDSFKNFIYSFYDYEIPEVETNKTVEELMDEAGYIIYKCNSEDEISSFRKYYKKTEELCSFGANRLDNYHVFFAIKKNVKDIRREDFKVPYREDEYGTSVISLQFSKGDVNPVSIKNRYNHIVANPDATFENNLENIAPGLTRAFEKEYNLNIIRPNKFKLSLADYVLANDGRYYKFNYEFNNIYYCPNNIIINKGDVLKIDSSRYKLIDYLLIDYHDKSIKLFDSQIQESFQYENLKKIDVHKNKENKHSLINLITNDDINIFMEIDESSRMISFKSDDITNIPDNYLGSFRYLRSFECSEALSIGNNVLTEDEGLINLNIDKVKNIGDEFLVNNNLLITINLPEVTKIGNSFLYYNEILSSAYLPNCEYIGDDFCFYNDKIENLNLNKIKRFGNNFFFYNNKIRKINMPCLKDFGDAPFGMHMQVYSELLEVVRNNGRKINNGTDSKVSETTSTKHR